MVRFVASEDRPGRLYVSKEERAHQRGGTITAGEKLSNLAAGPNDSAARQKKRTRDKPYINDNLTRGGRGRCDQTCGWVIKLGGVLQVTAGRIEK